MSALYDVLAAHCKRSGGTWKGDIHVLRHLLKSSTLSNRDVTQQLETLRHRGLINFYADKHSRRHIIWTVTMINPDDFYGIYFDTSGFVEAVDQVRQKRGITISAMCGQLGIDSRILNRATTGKHQSLYTDTMAVLVAWSGIDPRRFIKRREI